ncbi:MAG: LacI family DNA-binding transcriptional regulator [Rhodobacteraceae bacterium]|nr:LacI family DNA-binding transcriptional regulator [Paracoccaceae bacterium]
MPVSGWRLTAQKRYNVGVSEVTQLSLGRDTTGSVPKLEDVARRAGVSTATVSRCLNAPTRVSQSTRERVLSAVRDLGYAPNFGARALAAKRTNTFGAIIPTMDNAIFARGLQAFQDELSAHGITLLVASSSYERQTEAEQIAALVARGADALLLIGYDRTPETYAFLDKRQIPYVVTWVYDPKKGHRSIGFDNRHAMKQLALAVVDQGHTELALITADRAGNDRARERAEGLFDAMRERGISVSSLRLIETSYSIDNGARGFEELMASASPPTAILCGNDVLAAGALTAAHRLGIRVPEDVSVTGFDDIELASIVTPALTTVHVPHREMGRRAAKMLVALRNEREAGGSEELPTQIQWRASLGPAPQS